MFKRFGYFWIGLIALFILLAIHLVLSYCIGGLVAHSFYGRMFGGNLLMAVVYAGFLFIRELAKIIGALICGEDPYKIFSCLEQSHLQSPHKQRGLFYLSDIHSTSDRENTSAGKPH